MQGIGDNLVRLSVYKQEQKFLEFLDEPASTVIRIYKEVIKYRKDQKAGGRLIYKVGHVVLFLNVVFVLFFRIFFE